MISVRKSRECTPWLAHSSNLCPIWVTSLLNYSAHPKMGIFLLGLPTCQFSLQMTSWAHLEVYFTDLGVWIQPSWWTSWTITVPHHRNTSGYKTFNKTWDPEDWQGKSPGKWFRGSNMKDKISRVRCQPYKEKVGDGKARREGGRGQILSMHCKVE